MSRHHLAKTNDPGAPCGCRHKKLFELIEESTDVIYECDDQGIFTYVNGAVLKTLGYSPEMLIGRPYTDLIPDDARESTVRHYRWQFDTRTPASYLEFPALTIDGEVVWFGQSMQTVMENDRVAGFRAIARDITERRQAEEERQAIEERFHTFMNNIPAVAFVKDTAGRFIYVNESTRRIFGTARDTPLNTASSRRHDQEVLATGKSVQAIESMTMPSGETRQWLAYKFPVPSSTGTTYIGCVTIDLTERFALETELAAARDAALDFGATEVRVAGQHEPRDPHADERRSRTVRRSPGRRPHDRAARPRRDRAIERGLAAHDHQ